ncbi:hypothetical protein TIFTF001_003069 [Ficus carica]|uniref:Uncharacterized protein n=1 Tax=Ficus carica TaxID=3494 RepID=A0AA87ZQA0_FICCA|nr:hypothetical protein TIFTF001_003069 [Ficus carica]
MEGGRRMGDERRRRSPSSRRRCGRLALEAVDGDVSSPETLPRRSSGSISEFRDRKRLSGDLLH